MGDFQVPENEQILREGAWNYRLPIKWYTSIIEKIRLTSHLPIYIFADATDKFIKDYSKILKHGLNKDISVQAPYKEKNKVELIREFKQLPLDKTMTCMQPVGMIHCNACNKCKERRDAFEQAGVQDETKYNHEGYL